MINEFWAIVELMGHIRMAGKVSEEEHFGSKVGRIDIPQQGGGFVTQFFGGGSVYRITAVTEEAARSVALSNKIEPIHAYEMPKAITSQNGRLVTFEGRSEDTPQELEYGDEDRPY